MLKKYIIILLSLLPLAALGQSSLYHHYAQRQNLTVAEVAGFKLNDTVKVDVVIVVADNNAAWRQLKKELDIRNSEGTTSWLGHADRPEVRCGWTSKPVCRIVASHSRRTVAFYLLETEAQYDALVDYQMKKIEK